MLENLNSLIKKIKKEHLVIGFILLAVILLISSTHFKTNEKSYSSDTESFVEYLEQKLIKSISKMDGVKKVSVVITVNGGITTQIAEEVKKVEENGKITTTSSPIFAGGKPIVLGEIYPQIIGVVVVCDCKNSLTVKMSILDLVTTALDIPCEKVRILTQ